MKKLNIIKIIQLIFLIAISIISIVVIYTDKNIYHFVFKNKNILLLCELLWIVLLFSFLFLIFDFTFFRNFKIDYNKLNRVAYSNPESGIPNRYSCDTLIAKYENQILPENLSCIMIELSNLYEINKLYGYQKGNELIKEFSCILMSASLSLCFVGNNGGNKFLAIFQESSKKKLDLFVERVDCKVKQHNSNDDKLPIEFRFGISSNEEEHLEHLPELIALANKRIK
ncbi:GGDEF domain-containing protein [Lachnospiraceae bacterium LCP25S3_G4]